MCFLFLPSPENQSLKYVYLTFDGFRPHICTRTHTLTYTNSIEPKRMTQLDEQKSPSSRKKRDNAEENRRQHNFQKNIITVNASQWEHVELLRMCCVRIQYRQFRSNQNNHVRKWKGKFHCGNEFQNVIFSSFLPFVYQIKLMTNVIRSRLNSILIYK